jgi:hypothetical protein
MLTEAQVKHFQTFGFLILRQLFNAAELKVIRAEFEHGLGAAYRHLPFDGTLRHWVPMMGPETPFFASLLEDPRFHHVAAAMYGDDVLGTLIDANRYIGDSPWHPDTASLHQYGVKFAFYLEPVRAEIGALRVIPGSHKRPLHDEIVQHLAASHPGFRDVPAYICSSEPGDVVAFDLRLWHGSCGGAADRRMCTVVFYNNPKTAEEEEVTRRQAAANPDFAEIFGRPVEPLYHPHWVANPQGNPMRQRWINRLRELGFLD